MESILTPVSFKERRVPYLEKVGRDADIMYENARYVITLDDVGRVIEQRFNRRIDDEVVDCLAVFAPFTYKGVRLERTLVLEIGFRRFVPYAQTEHRLGASTRRGPVVRLKKGEERKEKQRAKRKKGKMAYVIKARVPVASFTEDALFDLMPTITKGIQECVDSIVRAWTNTAAAYPRGTWHRFEYESSIVVRFPKEATLLCATASFAELEWRGEPDKQLAAIARSIRALLKGFADPSVKRRQGAPGSFDKGFLRKSRVMQYVAEKLSSRIRYKDYSRHMIERLLELVGPLESPERKIINQLWSVYKIPKPPHDLEFRKYAASYGEMKELLLEKWLVRNYRSFRLEKVKKDLAKLRKKENRPYQKHAKGCAEFSVFASKQAIAEMLTAYDAKKIARLVNQDLPLSETVAPQIVSVLENDDDIPWDTGPAQKTGTDDDIPF